MYSSEAWLSQVFVTDLSAQRIHRSSARAIPAILSIPQISHHWMDLSGYPNPFNMSILTLFDVISRHTFDASYNGHSRWFALSEGICVHIFRKNGRQLDA